MRQTLSSKSKASKNSTSPFEKRIMNELKGLAAGLEAVEKRLDEHSVTLEQIDRKFEQRLGEHSVALEQIDARFDELDSKFEKRLGEHSVALEQIDARFDELDSKFEKRLNERQPVTLEQIDAIINVRLDNFESKFERKFREINAKVDDLESVSRPGVMPSIGTRGLQRVPAQHGVHEPERFWRFERPYRR